MEKKLLRDASNWTLQQDDEVRQLLEDFTNSVSNTGARLNLDIEQLKERVLSTDCDIQQLNIQLALLKNAKFVENTVEEEDSRPKPILPTVAFSKDEMIRIVVDSVKSTLKDVTAQLYWEREPLGIESLPTFNDEAFSFYSLGSSKPPSQVLQSTKIKADIVSLQETPPEVPTIPEMVPPAPNISFPVQNGFGDYSSEESEPEVQTSRVQTIPKPSSMDGLKQLAPVIPKPQARGLFSSDDEDENEKEQLITTSVQPVAPIVKPSQDLMQQLASKLKSRDSGATEAPKTVVVEAAEQERAPVLVKEETTVVKKEEPRPVAVQRRMVLPTAAEATSSTKVTSSVTVIKQEKKEEQPVQQKRIQEQVAPKTVVTRKESVKKRGLFSDSDSSEEEFMAPVKPATVKPVVKPVQELKKVEPAKTIARKTTPTVRKSIFDSDSSDEEITGFFKKSATVKNKATASSSLLHKRSVSPVKVASQPEPLEKTTPAVTEKISASDSSSPLKHETSAVVLVKSENQPLSTYPLAAEEELVLPSASIPTSNTSVPVASAPATVPVNTILPTPTPKEVSTEPSTPVSVAKTGPKVREKSPSPVRSLSPPRSVAKTEDLKKDEPLVREKSPPAVQSLPTTVRVAKTEESVDVQLSVSTALPPEPRLPSPLEEPPKYDPNAQPLTCESRSHSADVPPINETRSVTPPEEAPDHLEQDKLPPLPTADPLTDSPLEEEMPVGKAPGKLNNANFAAMLGRQLSAGPPGSRPKTASTPSTERPDPMNSASAASMSASPTTDSPGGLCHLTKSRPRRPNVHKPTIAKVDDMKTVVDPLASATNGDSDLKISSPSSASKQSSTPIAVKNPELTKVLNGSSSVATSKAEVKSAVRVIASVKSATTTSTTAKKGLFDFSSSDEELSSSSKITKAAATLKTSVTSGSPSLTLKPKSTPAPLPGTAASKSMPRNANLAKYKNMFDQEDDLDVSLFKKDKT